MRMRTGLLAIILLVLASACANPTSSASGGSADGGISGPSGGTGVVSPQPPINWDNPIGGEPVSNTAALSDLLSFQAVVPAGLGDPVGVFAIPASKGDGGAVDFVYDLDVGRTVVGEFPWDFAPKHWDEFVNSVVDASASAETPSPSGPTGEQVVVIGSAVAYQLPDGRTALVTLSDDGTQADVRWLTESGVEIVVQGPSLSKEAVTKLADTLSKQA